MTPSSPSAAGRPRVVVVGCGFGGLSAAKALGRADVDITLIDRRNYHLFQPLLYQVATAGLSPAEIAQPIRAIVRDQANTSVLLGRVTGVDTAARQVILDDRRVAYDYLILATGARHAYFGHDEWEAVAPGLKKIEDAIDKAAHPARLRARRDGDGRGRTAAPVDVRDRGRRADGVELAGAIIELAHRALATDFRSIDSREARVILVEAGPRLLPSFPEALSAKAKAAIEKLGVEVRLGTPVTACDPDGVTIGTERLGARTILWAAGVAASPAAKWIGAEKDRAGRIKVNADLSVPEHPEIFAIGDTALVLTADGKPVPGIAPAAKQQGAYVGKLINAKLAGKAAPAPFRYRNFGNLATIGRKAAVIDFGWVWMSGFFAWVLWSIAHIYFLIGFRNRLIVAMNWLWAYITFQRGSRLITGDAVPGLDD